MEGLPAWVPLLGNLVGVALAFVFLNKWKEQLEKRLVDQAAAHKVEIEGKDKRIEKLEAANAELNDKLVGAFRETLPALAQNSRVVEAIAAVIPMIAAAEPARITGGKSR